MALLVDKLRPRSLESLTYHSDLSTRLSALASTPDFPHTLFYGPSGSGKKTRILALLRALYGPGVEKIKIDARTFVTSSNRKLEFNIVSSIYHLEITPSDVGSYDRVVIQELLKEVAQTQQVDQSARQRFKVVVINEADSLSRDAQAALRRTMEKYSANVRLILLATTTSSIIAPIRSRTLLIRVPAPTVQEIESVLSSAVAAQKGWKQPLPAGLGTRIAEQSERNLRRALLMLEAVYATNPDPTNNTPIPPPDWEVLISQIADDILAERSPRQILLVRGKLYDLLTHCIPPSTVIKTLCWKLVEKVPGDEGLKMAMVRWAAHYEHRIRMGSKAIFHLEAYVARVMRVLEMFYSGMGVDVDTD